MGKKKLARDIKGYRVDLGRKLNTSGRRIQHRFYIRDCNEQEAAIRKERLQQLWEEIRVKLDGVWSEEFLVVADAIRKGKTRLVLPPASPSGLVVEGIDTQPALTKLKGELQVERYRNSVIEVVIAESWEAWDETRPRRKGSREPKRY